MEPRHCFYLCHQPGELHVACVPGREAACITALSGVYHDLPPHSTQLLQNAAAVLSCVTLASPVAVHCHTHIPVSDASTTAVDAANCKPCRRALPYPYSCL